MESLIAASPERRHKDIGRSRYGLTRMMLTECHVGRAGPDCLDDETVMTCRDVFRYRRRWAPAG
jgi:hypothetical protein